MSIAPDSPIRRVGLPLAFALGTLLLWEAVVRAFGIREVLLPTPSAMAAMAITSRHAWILSIISNGPTS